jgi:hypothetical protein
MRQGEQTVSWFRGPLAPLNYQKPTQVEEPVACADQLLRYDPDTGLFDVTFASAWQLGRLLALQNKSFALGLNRVRQSLRARSEEAMRQAELKSRRQALNMPDEDSMENSLLNKLISSRNTLFSYANGASSGTTPGNGDTNDKTKPFKDYAKDIIQQSLDELLADVSSWLGRLVLLYGVPFNYLIPDEKMLPRESIRFFFLDPVWIQYLIQGACSVGNNGYGDSLIDQAMNQWVQNDSSGDNTPHGRVAATAAGVRDRLRHQLEGGPQPEDSRLDWPLTGFLLRSSVVEGWRGLEIIGYGQNEVTLKPLRIEQLSSDVMLAIFNGVIGKVTIRQPQEGLHFGLTPEGSSYIKTLRDLGNVDPAKVGKLLKECTINLAALDLLRNNNNIVDIAALAKTMEKKLSGLGQLRDGRFTSAEFAVEMIEAAGEFNFIPQGKQ